MGTAALMAAPVLAIAHESTVSHEHPASLNATSTRPIPPKPPIQARATSTKPIRQEMKEEVKDMRELFKRELEEKRETILKDREAFREDIEERRASTTAALKNKREKFEDESKKRQDALKKKFGEERAKRIEEYFKNMVKKFEEAIRRHVEYSDKIAEFLNKAETNGKDVTELRAKLSVANTTLTEAERALENAKAKYSEVATSTAVRTRFKEVHTLVEGVAEKIRAAHQAFVEVISSTRGLGRGRATSTPPVATTTPPPTTTTSPTH